MGNVVAQTPILGCEHEAGMFRKGKIRERFGRQRSLLSRPPCIFCEHIYPIWKDYAKECQHQPYVEGLAHLRPLKNPVPLMSLDGDQDMREKFSPFQVLLDSKQLGEAYHVLIAALLLRTPERSPTSEKFCIKICIGKGDGAGDIQDLFNWYRIETTTTRYSRSDTKSKKKATRLIAAAFRSSNQPVTDSQGSDGNKVNQPSLFTHLRRDLLSSRFHLTEGDALQYKYFEPTYAAKYWLNRYLSLTGQGKLPKSEQVSRLAVIHIRRSAQTLVGRKMDDKTLEHVVESITHANQLAHKAKATSFTHVILYGDFDYHEIDHLKKVVEDKLHETRPGTPRSDSAKKHTKDRLKVLFISRPWKHDSEDLPDSNNPAFRSLLDKIRKPQFKGLRIPRWRRHNAADLQDQDEPISQHLQGKNGEVAELWEKFRNRKFDHLPIHVKSLAL